MLGGAVTTISANTDLNDLTTYKRYVSSSGTTTQTLSNCPVSVAFTLDVFPVPGGQYIYQTLYAASSPLQIWSRRKSQYGFDNWQRIDGMFAGVMPNNTDVKELGEGRYIKNANVTGATGYPSQVTGSFIVEVVRDSLDNTSSHIWLYDIALPGAVYFNCKWSGSWRGWQRIDNYGTSTAAELATLLGVNRFIGIMPNNTSVKDLAYGRYAKNSSVTGATGYPSSVTGSFIVEVVCDSVDNSISHIWLYDITIPGNVYYNIKWGGSWRGWRKVTAITEE